MKSMLRYSCIIHASQQELYDYYSKEEIFYRIVPPTQEVVRIRRTKVTDKQSLIQITLRKRNILVTVINENPPELVVTKQITGFLSSYDHKHFFYKKASEETELVDELEFKIPGGILGRLLFSSKINKMMGHAFKFRYRVVKEDFRQMYAHRPFQKLKIVVSGASGFVGAYLVALLKMFNYEVFTLVRSPSTHPSEIHWDPEKKILDRNQLEGMDAIIHLTGENIAEHFWTKREKEKIYTSRVHSTAFLANELNALKNPPKLFLCASACGFYGDRGEEEVTESASCGEGFLAEVAQAWEKSANIYQKGRVVSTRFGVVIHPKGGILKKMLPLFRLGLGAVLGNRKRWMSWISLDDLMYQIIHIIHHEKIEGAINLTTPKPVTYEEFAVTLAKTLKRPLFFTISDKLIKALFKEKGEELFLKGAKVKPKKLEESGAVFSYPDLSDALQHYLGK